jgi:type IV secretory pathway VirB2 component (pilin)
MASCERLAVVPRELGPLWKDGGEKLAPRTSIGVEHTFPKLSPLISFFGMSSYLALNLHVLLSTPRYIRCHSGLVSRRNGLQILGRIITFAVGTIARCFGFLVVLIIGEMACFGSLSFGTLDSED